MPDRWLSCLKYDEFTQESKTIGTMVSDSTSCMRRAPSERRHTARRRRAWRLAVPMRQTTPRSISAQPPARPRLPNSVRAPLRAVADGLPVTVTVGFEGVRVPEHVGDGHAETSFWFFPLTSHSIRPSTSIMKARPCLPAAALLAECVAVLPVPGVAKIGHDLPSVPIPAKTTFAL